MTGPRLTTRPPATTSLSKGVGATARPGIAPTKKGSRPIAVSPDLVTPDHPQREFQERFGASGHQCPGIFFDRLPVSSSTRLDAVQTSILVSRFFAQIWRPPKIEESQSIPIHLTAEKGGFQYIVGAFSPDWRIKHPHHKPVPVPELTATNENKRRSDSEVAEAMKRASKKTRNFDEQVKIAAKELGILPRAIRFRISKASKDSRLAEFKQGELREVKPERLTERQLYKAIIDALSITNDFDQALKLVADVYGTTKDKIIDRIKEAPKSSPLRTFQRRIQ